MNGHDLELELEGCTSWQEKANFLADLFCQDTNDKELVKADTYDYNRFGATQDYGLTNEGEFGDWVMVSAYRKLSERFLLAMELIKAMEENMSVHDDKKRISDTLRCFESEGIICDALYRNSSDESDDGKWIEEKDYRKVAKDIVSKFNELQ